MPGLVATDQGPASLAASAYAESVSTRGSTVKKSRARIASAGERKNCDPVGAISLVRAENLVQVMRPGDIR
jgi:hypothetical protein